MLAQQQFVQAADGGAAAGCCDPGQNPFGWVPDDHTDVPAAAAGADVVGSSMTAGEARISSVRPRTAQIRSRTATSLPLEFFNSPEMETVDIQQQLQTAAAEAPTAGADGGPGLQGLSRFYSPDGSFSWKPCTVLQYDR